MSSSQNGHDDAGLVGVVCPLRSGSVVQSSLPGVCASTNTKSQLDSVSRSIQNESSPPPAGTSIVRASRLYERSATCESANWSPVRGEAAA